MKFVISLTATVDVDKDGVNEATEEATAMGQAMAQALVDQDMAQTVAVERVD